MSHLDFETLDAYRTGRLNCIKRLIAARHLKQCEVCRKKLEELREQALLVRSLRDACSRYDSVEDQLHNDPCLNILKKTFSSRRPHSSENKEDEHE